MRRRLRLISLLACLGLLASAAMMLFVPSLADPDARFFQIREGMAEAEVKAILGEPQRASTWFVVRPIGKRQRCSVWCGERRDLTVFFSPAGTADYLVQIPNSSRPLT
jgi:hypothetical protein